MLFFAIAEIREHTQLVPSQKSKFYITSTNRYENNFKKQFEMFKAGREV